MIIDEVRSEIDYYVRKHHNLESEISYIVRNKSSYSKEDYEQAINDNKIRYYINTNILDEVALTKEVLKSR